MIKQNIPQVLQHARFLINLTQEEAAQLVGVTRRAWAHWEDGTRKMPLSAFELFIAKISAQVRSNLQPEAGQELVVVFGDDQVTPIDVVSNDNFLSISKDSQTGRYVISSLAIAQYSGKKYKHQVSFLAEGNELVLEAAGRWQL